MGKNKINYKLINILIGLLIISLLYWISGLWLGIFEKIMAILFPFIIAFAIAYALNPFCKKLTNCGFPRWLAVGTIYFLIIGFTVLIGIIVVPMFYDQLYSF